VGTHRLHQTVQYRLAQAYVAYLLQTSNYIIFKNINKHISELVWIVVFSNRCTLINKCTPLTQLHNLVVAQLHSLVSVDVGKKEQAVTTRYSTTIKPTEKNTRAWSCTNKMSVPNVDKKKTNSVRNVLVRECIESQNDCCRGRGNNNNGEDSWLYYNIGPTL